MENTEFENKLGIGYPVHRHMNRANNVAKFYAEEILKILSKEGKRHKDEYSKIALICRGSSGAIMSTFTYNHLINIDKDLESRINVFHIKKEGETNHGNSNGGIQSLNFDDEKSCFIIDDFIDTGETISSIYEVCKEHNIPVLAIIASWYRTSSGIIEKYKDTEIKYLVSEPV